MNHKLRIVSLGSSFAAGPGIEPIYNTAAGRSSRNYAHQLAEKLGADLTDLSVSGATLLNVLDEQQVTETQTFDPQLNHLPSDTDIVTLTCGGNDLDYLGSLIRDTLVSQVGPKHPLLGGRTATAPALSQQQITFRLTKVLDKIHSIAPEAKVYLVQYLAVIGNDTRPLYDVALTADRMAHYDATAKLLAQAYYDAAETRTWAAVVPVAEASRSHALGSAEPWIRGFSLDALQNGPAPYHPNLAGHTAIAEILYEQVVAYNGTIMSHL